VPDELYGEAVMAFVERRKGSSLDEQAVIEHTKALIAGYKKPKYVEFVDALPRNAIGKVLKNELRATARKVTA